MSTTTRLKRSEAVASLPRTSASEAGGKELKTAAQLLSCSADYLSEPNLSFSWSMKDALCRSSG